ncbi:hypothetical protein [Streptomyces sp. NPDC014623]|uniref:hypothetical protein n=1 Tax=Streptomyces sp. NPDC014623 TaxID=3364875 RepID=UPI0036F9D689
MTMTQRRRGVPVTANPRQGVRVQRSAALRRTEAGRIALPLSITQNGKRLADSELVMTCDAAAELYAELGRVLAEAGHPAGGAAPCP